MKTTYHIQILSGSGRWWLDYAKKESAEIALDRIQELKKEFPERTFRGIVREYTETVLEEGKPK